MIEAKQNRGRTADHPGEIPLPGWKDILIRVWRDADRNNISLIAAGVAFYLLLALFPGLAALVSIYSVLAEPEMVQDHLAIITAIMPVDARKIIEDQLVFLTDNQQQLLSWGAGLGLLIAIWSATKGAKAMMGALNVVYQEHEKRGIIKLNLIALVFTLSTIVGLIIILSSTVMVPIILEKFSFGTELEFALSWLRWPALFAFILLGLAIIFRFAPSRSQPKWRWIGLGSILAAVLWVLGSLGFSLYIREFAAYNKTYGAIGAVVILLMWFYLSAYLILLSALLNAEVEHQTRKDTTTGEPKPMGERGAHVADTLGESP